MAPSMEAAPAFNPEWKSPIKDVAFLPSALLPGRRPPAWDRQPRMPFARTAKFRKVWKRYDFRSTIATGKHMKDSHDILSQHNQKNRLVKCQGASPSTPRVVKKLRLGSTDGEDLDSGRKHSHPCRSTSFDYFRNSPRRKLPKTANMDAPLAVCRADWPADSQVEGLRIYVQSHTRSPTKCSSPSTTLLKGIAEKTHQTFDFSATKPKGPEMEGRTKALDGPRGDGLACMGREHASIQKDPRSPDEDMVVGVSKSIAELEQHESPGKSVHLVCKAQDGEGVTNRGTAPLDTPHHRSAPKSFHNGRNMDDQLTKQQSQPWIMATPPSTSNLSLRSSRMDDSMLVFAAPTPRRRSAPEINVPLPVCARSLGQLLLESSTTNSPVSPARSTNASRGIGTCFDSERDTREGSGCHSSDCPASAPADDASNTQSYDLEWEKFKSTGTVTTGLAAVEDTRFQEGQLGAVSWQEYADKEVLMSPGSQSHTVNGQESAAADSPMDQIRHVVEEVSGASPSLLDSEAHSLQDLALPECLDAALAPAPNLEPNSVPEPDQWLEISDIAVASPTLYSLTPTLACLADHDDAEILKDFLSRAKASKATRMAKRSSVSYRRDSDAVRHALASPGQAGVLTDLDINSPSPRKRDVVELQDVPTPTKTIPHCDTTTATDPKLGTTITGQAEAAPIPARRSTRSRLPAPSKNPKPSSSPPNRIPVRRADGAESLILKRTEAQELALLTRNNTRRNKGGAVPAAVLLLKLRELKVDDSIGEDWDAEMEAEREVECRKLRWDDRLAYFQDDGEKEGREGVVEDEPVSAGLGVVEEPLQVGRETRMRRLRAPGTPAKGLLGRVSGPDFSSTDATATLATGPDATATLLAHESAAHACPLLLTEQAQKENKRSPRLKKHILPTPTPTPSKELKLKLNLNPKPKLNPKTVMDPETAKPGPVMGAGKENKENKTSGLRGKNIGLPTVNAAAGVPVPVGSGGPPLQSVRRRAR